MQMLCVRILVGRSIYWRIYVGDFVAREWPSIPGTIVEAGDGSFMPGSCDSIVDVYM